MENKKLVALSLFLDAEKDEITEVDESTFKYAQAEYKVLTDDEADEAAKEYIKESLWAFNTSFISSHCKVSLSVHAEKALQKMQGELCDDANELVACLIEDMDEFISDAINADGRGHFVSSYDGEENEQEVEGETLYIYRTN